MARALTGGPEVFLVWTPGAEPQLAARLLVDEAERLLGEAASEARLTHHCAVCGSTRHGRPLLIRPDGEEVCAISVSRAPDLTVVALSPSGPVGVDVERPQAADSPELASVAAHEAEHDVSTTTWVRKESLLKALGRGLSVDPRLVRVSPPGEPPALVEWAAPHPPEPPPWMFDVVLPTSHVSAVTVLGHRRPGLVVRAAGPAVRPRRAMR